MVEEIKFLFYVSGRSLQTGDTFCYTGKAGEGYASSDLKNAFLYETSASAKRRAEILNLGTPQTGITWAWRNW